MPQIQMRAIRPPPFKSEAFNKEFRTAVNYVGQRSKTEFKGITAEWKHKVTWHYRTEERANYYKFTIFVNNDKAGEILSYWVFGTKPHIIMPKKRGGALSFYWPKGAAYGVAKKDGGTVVRYVKHPGTKPHVDIINAIIERAERIFILELIAANERAVKACGHGI